MMNTGYVDEENREALKNFILKNKFEHPTHWARHWKQAKYAYSTVHEYRFFNDEEFLLLKMKFNWIRNTRGD